MKPIFLSYSRQDEKRARELYEKLKRSGFQVWFDQENLLPGQIWEVEIKEAIQRSALVIVLLSSRSVSRAGYAQKEIRTALDFMEQIPAGRPYLIPLKLDECDTPTNLAHIHFGTLHNEVDFQRLLKALSQYVDLPVSTDVVPTNYARYINQFKNDELLILPGYGAARVRIGERASTVEERLGAPEEIKTFKGRKFQGKVDPEVSYHSYYRRGICVVVQEGAVDNVFLYGVGQDNWSAFAGATPEGVTVASRRNEIEAVFGRPSKVGGDGVIDYWVSYSIGISVTYKTLDVNNVKARVRELAVHAPR